MESTVPMPRSSATDVAPDTCQLRTLVSPGCILGGLNAKYTMTGGPDGAAVETLTTVVAVVLPSALVAVSIYAVVAVGETVAFAVAATLPSPWLRDTNVASCTIQLNTADWPGDMVDGLALKELITGALADGEGAPDTTTCTVATSVLPAAFDATSV
jgi:hypothetical protein